MADSGIFGFTGGPTFFKQSDRDAYANMMASPMSRTATFGSSILGGVLKSDVLGTGIRDIWTPEGNVDLSQQTADIAQGKVGSLLGQDIKIPVLGSLYGAAKAGVQAFVNDRNSPAMTEAQYKASPYFREAIPYDPAMTEQRAAALAMAYDRSQVREFFGAKRPVVSFIGNMAGQAVDPINYIPIMGPAVKAAAAAKFGKVVGGALIGSSDAAINTAIADIATAPARGKYGDDVSWQSIITDIGVGALIGSAFGGVFGGVEMHYDAKRAKVEAAKAARLRAPGVVSVDEGAFVGTGRGEVTIPHDPLGPLRERIKSPSDVGGDVTVRLPDIRDITTGRIALNEAIGYGAHGEPLNLSPNTVESVKRMAAEGAAHADSILPPTDIGRKVAAEAHAAGEPVSRAAGIGQLIETVLTSFGRRAGQTADEVGALLPPLEFRGEGAAIPEGRMAAQEGGAETFTGRYDDGGEFQVSYNPVQRSDGRWALERTITDETGTRTEHQLDSSEWSKGEAPRTAMTLGRGIKQIGANVESHLTRDAAMGFASDDAESMGANDPRTMFQSAAPLQGMPPDVTRTGPVAGVEGPLPVTGSGPGGRVVLTDLARALTARHMARYGRRLDPNDPADYAVVLQSLKEDYANQGAQSDNGEAWYVEDINEAIRVTTQIIPELAEPKNRELFLTMAALLSPQQKPRYNWGNAILAMQGYLRDGVIPLRKPNGKQFGVDAHTTGLQLLQHLINTKGLEEALIWVKSPHTGREMAEVRRDSGLFAPKARVLEYLPAETNSTDVKLGIYMMGPKVGDFAQNATGLDQNAITIDLWAMRTYNRLIGRLLDVPEKIAAKGGLPDQPRGGEREMLKRLMREAAQDAGINPSAMQAALWYFEQRLYRNHGIRSDSQNFSGAARTAAQERGIVVDRQPDRGSEAGGDGNAGGGIAQGVRASEAGGAASDQGVGVSFVSPNVKQLDFAGSEQALSGERQKSLRSASSEIDQQLGLKTTDHDIIGAWSDGAENSTMTIVDGADWDTMVLSAAMKGHLADQKAVLVFKQGDGTSALYRFEAKGSLDDIHKSLLEDGVAFHTIVPNKDGATIYVADLDGSAREAVRKAALRHGTKVQAHTGRAEFIGTTKEDGTDRAQRDDARRVYEGVIGRSSVRGAAAVWEGVHNRWGETLGERIAGETDEAAGKTLFQPGPEGRRGSITFGSDKTIISLFQRANASTALHESGHYFLEIFKKLAEHENAPEELKGDWQAIKDWWLVNADAVARDSSMEGITAKDVRTVLARGTTGDRVKDIAIDRGLHEQWARAFEKYLREGKAPTEELRSVFQQFKQWLTDVYKKALDLNVELSPELRGVFDRMLGAQRKETPEGTLDVAALMRSPDIKEAIDKMAAIPATDDKAKGYGSPAWYDGRIFNFDGEQVRGVAAAVDRLVERARNLATKETGKPVQEILRERRAEIVIGAPASGKSTIANGIALRLRAAVADVDDAKQVIPEYQGGLGANAVHEESSELGEMALARLINSGDNLVIPKVGHKLSSIEGLRDRLKNEGYSVTLVLMDVKPDTALRRMIARFDNTGRIIPPSYFMEVAHRPKITYNEAKKGDEFDGYAIVQSEDGSPTRVTEVTGKVSTLARGERLERGGQIRFDRAEEPGAARPPASRQAIDTTVARPDPIPAGRKEAEASLTKPDRAKEEAADLGIDLATGHADELDQIEELRTMGILSPEDEAAMKAADDDFVIAEAYGNTLKAALFCVA